MGFLPNKDWAAQVAHSRDLLQGREAGISLFVYIKDPCCRDSMQAAHDVD